MKPLDDWKTPAVRDAEVRLADAVSAGYKALTEARRLRESLRAQPASVVSEDDVSALRAAATSRTAPRELRVLAERVAAGDLTWLGILRGDAMADPDVRAAMAPAVERAARLYRAFEEGATFDDVLNAETYDDRPPTIFRTT